MEIGADKTAHISPTVKPITKLGPPQDTPKPIVCIAAAVNLVTVNESPVFIYKNVYYIHQLHKNYYQIQMWYHTYYIEMYICTYTYIHIYIYTYIHIYICICINFVLNVFWGWPRQIIQL